MAGRPLRILQMVQRPQRRGAEVYAVQLADELRRRGHAVDIICLYPYTGDHRLSFEVGGHLLEGNERHWTERSLGFNPQLLAKLVSVIGEFHPDIIQANAARTLKYASLARRLRRQEPWRLVYRVMGNPMDWMNSRSHRLFYRHVVVPQVDGIAAVSHSAHGQLKGLYGDAIPVTVIPQAVDGRAFRPGRSREEVRQALDVPDDALVIVYVGSLSQEKRPDRFIRTARKVMSKQKHAHAWILGDGAMRSELEAEVEVEGLLRGRVQFLGVQSAVADYMGAADLLLLTSDTEGIPGVILEAGYMGLPAVATRVGGVGECVIEGETGLLAEREDEARLAEAVVRLLDDPSERARMGANARRWIQERFTIDVVAAQYVAFYERLLGREEG